MAKQGYITDRPGTNAGFNRGGNSMPAESDRLLAAICEVLRTCPAVKRAVLFGSRSRGDCTMRSDYDIAVYGDLPHEQRAKLRYAIENDMPTLHKIDLLFICELHDDDLTENIKKEGVTIYE